MCDWGPPQGKLDGARCVVIRPKRRITLGWPHTYGSCVSL